jgi:hypothetical protein
MGSFKRSKTSGTGMSQSHIGKTNLDGLEAAANVAAPVPFVEPAPPVPGGVALWVSPGNPIMGDPSAGALLAIWTDEAGGVHRAAVASGVGPGPVPVP